MSDEITTPNPVPARSNSFDTLESILDVPEAVETKTTEEAKPVESTEAKGKPITETFKDAPSEEAKDEEGKPEAVEAKSEETPAEVEQTEEEKAAAKSLKLKVGPRGKELELPLDVKIPVTIDGEEKEFTIQELRNLKSGEVSYDKKFTELDTDRKAFIADKEQTTKELNSILELVYNNDVGGAILEMARIAGLDPTPMYKAFQDATVGDINKFKDMTDLEREAYMLRKENEFLKGIDKSVMKSKVEEQAKLELNQKTQQLRETLDVSDEWISKAQADLKANAENYKSWLKDAAPTEEHVVKLADVLKRMDVAAQALEKVDPELAKDPFVFEYAVEKLRGQKGVTVDKAVEVIQKFFRIQPKEPSTPPKASSEAALVKKIEQANLVSDEDETGEVAVKPKREARSSSYKLSWDD